MSEATAADVDAEATSTSADLRGAAVASVVAGIAFGVLIQFVMGSMATIGALFTFGQEGLVQGWVTHMFLSLVFGLLYAVLTWSDSLAGYASEASTGLALGAGFGIGLWAVNVGFVWPVWMNLVGINSMLPIPFLFEMPALQSFGGHVVWGGVLGAVYPLVRE